MSVALFTIMAIIAAILLLITGIAAAVGASKCWSSALYSTQSSVRSAYSYLVSAAILAFAALVVIIVILIAAWVGGGYTRAEIAAAILAKPDNSLTTSDVYGIYLGEQELLSGTTTSLIVFVFLVIIVIVNFIVGILCAVAASYLSTPKTSDSNASTAYGAAIVGAISSIAGVIILIIAVVAYAAVRSYRYEQIKMLDAAKLKREQELKITDANLIAGTAPTVPVATTTTTTTVKETVAPAQTVLVSQNSLPPPPLVRTVPILPASNTLRDTAVVLSPNLSPATPMRQEITVLAPSTPTPTLGRSVTTTSQPVSRTTTTTTSELVTTVERNTVPIV